MDNRLRKLKISFPKDWTDISSENPDGPPTFLNNSLDEPGVLQISTAEFIVGEKPNPDFTDLITLSENIGLKNEFGEILNKDYGLCNFGKYGKVEFSRKDFPYISVWHLSNGEDIIFSTFICSKTP